MNENRTKVTINILGVDYNVITEQDADRVKEIAGFVDALIKSTKASAPQMSTLHAAILSLLNISEELYETKENLDELKDKEDDYKNSEETSRQLEVCKQELIESAAKIKSAKTKIEKMQMENDELNDMLDEYKDKYNALRTEYELNKRTLNDLQNKLLENQIELVKARKTLLDFDE